MFRTLAAAVGFATLAVAGAASAQTYGQPIYLNAYGRPIVGSQPSGVDIRSYVGAGRWSEGYSDRPYVYMPAPGYGQNYGYDYGYGQGRYGRSRHGRNSYGYGHGHGHGHARGHGGHERGYSRYDPPSQPGYRDWWGYNDDRPPSARRGRSGRRVQHDHDRACGCPDVYFYDR